MDAWLERWSPGLYRFALSLCKDAHLAEDLAQETLLRAWKHRGSLRNPAQLRVWLFRIAANLWKDHLKRAESRLSQPEPLLMEFEDTSIRSTLEGKEDLQAALGAMRNLPDRQREILYLHACECMSLAEIADVLGIAKDAAKASLALARKKMRERLSDLVPGPIKSE